MTFPDGGLATAISSVVEVKRDCRVYSFVLTARQWSARISPRVWVSPGDSWHADRVLDFIASRRMLPHRARG